MAITEPNRHGLTYTIPAYIWVSGEHKLKNNDWRLANTSYAVVLHERVPQYFQPACGSHEIQGPA